MTPTAADGDADAGLGRRLALRYGLFLAGFGGLIGGMALAERAGLPRAWIGAVFLVVTVASYAGIGFLCRTASEAEYFVAGRRVPALFNGMATAADWMSAASFIGTAGVLYLSGYGGLVYILGWTGGFCLLSLLLAPYLRRFGQYTVPDFLGARYGGRWPRLLGALAAIGVSFVYLVVQIHGIGLITAHLTGFGFELGVFVGLGGVLVCSFLGGMRAVTWTQVAQYLVLIVAYLVPLVWLSLQSTGSALPWSAYGRPLQQIAAREAALARDPAERAVAALQRERAEQALHKLQDVPAAMRADEARARRRIAELRAAEAPPSQVARAERELAGRPRSVAEARARYQHDHDDAAAHARLLQPGVAQTRPYAGGDPAGSAQARARFSHERVNFIALMLCLMMGTAAMPHLIMRSYTTRSPSQARRSVAWALLFITLLYLAAPMLAVLVKAQVLQHVVGLPISELPDWIGRWSRHDPNLVSVRDLNHDGRLQWGELSLGGDLIVLAAPEIGGLPYWVSCLVAAGGLAAALSTADGLLLTIANALTHDIGHRLLAPRASAATRVVASKVMLMVAALLAALVASLDVTDILRFVSAAFSLAAAAFFPALVMGVFWRRANRAGAVAAMVVGPGLCLGYMAVNLPSLRAALGVSWPAAACRWFGVDAVAAGIFAVPAGLLALVLASRLTPPPDAATQALVDRVRYPQPGE